MKLFKVLTAYFHATQRGIRRWLVPLGEGGGPRSPAHPDLSSSCLLQALGLLDIRPVTCFWYRLALATTTRRANSDTHVRVEIPCTSLPPRTSMTARYSHRAYAPCSVILSRHCKKNKLFRGQSDHCSQNWLRKTQLLRLKEVFQYSEILPGEGRRRAKAVPNNLEGCTARGAGSTFLVRFVKQARLLYSTVDDLSLSFSLGFTPCPTLFLFVPLPLSHSSLGWVSLGRRRRFHRAPITQKRIRN